MAHIVIFSEYPTVGFAVSYKHFICHLGLQVHIAKYEFSKTFIKPSKHLVNLLYAATL